MIEGKHGKFGEVYNAPTGVYLEHSLCLAPDHHVPCWPCIQISENVTDVTEEESRNGLHEF